jgi:hypothetical protein
MGLARAWRVLTRDSKEHAQKFGFPLAFVIFLTFL